MNYIFILHVFGFIIIDSFTNMFGQNLIFLTLIKHRMQGNSWRREYDVPCVALEYSIFLHSACIGLKLYDDACFLIVHSKGLHKTHILENPKGYINLLFKKIYNIHDGCFDSEGTIFLAEIPIVRRKHKRGRGSMWALRKHGPAPYCN
jgi:hypothetical protein